MVQTPGHIDMRLSPDEAAFLSRTGRKLEDYVALVAPCTDRGVGVGMLPNGSKVLSMTLTVLIPYEHLPLKISGVVGPDGAPMASSSILTQIPGAPMVRMLVARSALGAEPRAFVDAQVEAAKAALAFHPALFVSADDYADENVVEDVP